MDLEIGQEIDGYKIRGILGRGGMGVVYEAEDVALSRAVALKAINPELTQDEQFIRRFQTEARVLAKVNSPYIVGVHALRKTDLGLFIVMEFVEGGTLADRLDEGLMPLPEALRIVRQMLLAFEHAHQAGVIHRDIKPANIMITPSGVVKVTDFGLAKQSQPDMMSTVTQGVMGTLYYMSPEQVRGMGDVDHRSDLYSLGMTVYEMLAGRLPFEKGDGEFDIMRSIVDKEFPSPKDYNPDCPTALSDIVMRVISKKADDRYQSADEMLAAIDAYDSVPEEKARPTPLEISEQPDQPDPPKPTETPGAVPSDRTSLLSRNRIIGLVAVFVMITGILFLPDILSNTSDQPQNEIATVDTPTLSTIPDAAVAFPNDQDLREKPINAIEDPADVDATEAANTGSTEPTVVIPQRGEIILNIEPSAEILLDETPVTAGKVITRAAGMHTVLFRHPVYGEIKREIEVVADRRTNLTCFFEAQINIFATPWGTVYIDGQKTQLTTDTQTYLGPGFYDIWVKKFDHNTELLDGAARRIQINRSCGEQEHFEFVFRLTEIF